MVSCTISITSATNNLTPNQRPTPQVVALQPRKDFSGKLKVISRLLNNYFFGIQQSNSEEQMFTGTRSDMPKISINRRGSQSVANLRVKSNDSSIASYVDSRKNSNGLDDLFMSNDAKQTKPATHVSSAPQGHKTKKVGVPRLVKSDKPKRSNDPNRFSLSSASSKSSASRIPVLVKRRKSMNQGTNVSKPSKQRRKWQKPCCQNIAPVKPVEAAINRPVFKRTKTVIPPKPRISIDENEIAHRWESIKKSAGKHITTANDSSLRKTTSSPQLKECTLLYEVNLKAKDPFSTKSFSALDTLRRHGSLNRALSDTVLNEIIY